MVPEDALDGRTEALCSQLVLGAPLAQQAAKQLVAEVAGRTVDAQLCEHTAQAIARQRASAEGREGLSAFLDKRPPAWLARD